MNKTHSALATLGFALLFVVAHTFPYPGVVGVVGCLLGFAMLTAMAGLVVRGLGLRWLWLAYVLGFLGMFHWMPRMISVMGGMPLPAGFAGLALFSGYESIGPVLAMALFRALYRRQRPVAATLVTAGAIVAWEALGWHIYPINWAYSLGAVPVLARATAFTGSWGAAALMWVAGLWSGMKLAEGDRSWKGWGAQVALIALFAGLGSAWYLLPRAPRKVADVVMVQPNFPPGRAIPGMEAIGWNLTEQAMTQAALPKADAPTLVLWAESSILGWDHRGPVPALTQAAQKHGVTWIFGTEGGAMNLVRAEGGGQPPMVLGKVYPMPFGERMPGPEGLRQWLDQQTNRLSQVPGTLTPQSSFDMASPNGPIRIHSVICNEALMPARVVEGLAIAGGDLLTNHTNDGWFDRSLATDQHAGQIRLRAPEMGIPLLRATLTGKSGIFREDGTWELWGEAQTEATHTFRLDWQPVKTPWRNAGWRWSLLVAYVAMTGWVLVRRH